MHSPADVRYQKGLTCWSLPYTYPSPHIQLTNLFDVAKCPRLRSHVLHHSRDDDGGTSQRVVAKELPKGQVLGTPPLHLRRVKIQTDMFAVTMMLQQC